MIHFLKKILTVSNKQETEQCVPSKLRQNKALQQSALKTNITLSRSWVHIPVQITQVHNS